jgi:hypothetical protein
VLSSGYWDTGTAILHSLTNKTASKSSGLLEVQPAKRITDKTEIIIVVRIRLNIGIF